jgi:hypothetical protein
MTKKEAKQKLWACGNINTLSKVECDNILNEVFDDFESRTCESCRHCESQFGEMFCQLEELKTQEYNSIMGFTDVCMEVSKDFGCNKWREK